MKSKYIITSDWHIGSDVCQRDKIIKMLKSINTEILILNGDIVDIDHVKRLKKKVDTLQALVEDRGKDKHPDILEDRSLPGNFHGHLPPVYQEMDPHPTYMLYPERPSDFRLHSDRPSDYRFHPERPFDHRVPLDRPFDYRYQPGFFQAGAFPVV
jgi:hypothetical protein